MTHIIAFVFCLLSFFIPTNWKILPDLTKNALVTVIIIYLFIHIIGRLSAALKDYDYDTLRTIARKYGFYFLFPKLSCRVSIICAIFQFIFIVGCLLSYNLLSSVYALLTYAICAVIRMKCNPVFFAREGLKKFGDNPKSRLFFMDKLFHITYVYEKIYDRELPLPE